MSTQLPDITSRVRIDTTDLSNAVGRATRSGTAIGTAIGSTIGQGVSIGVAKLQDFSFGAVDAFAAVEDATSAAQVQFGDSLKTVLEFADGSAEAYGISKRAALDAQNTFGTFGKAAGLTGDKLATFAGDLTGLAGDLASFKGTSTEQAIGAIGAALRGESEPIRAYGVLLDDATLKQEALKLGLIKTTKDALTPQQKVLAVQAALFERTKDAQGDAAKTANSTANTQKRLAVAAEDAQVALGQRLAPAITVVRGATIGLIVSATGLIDVLGSSVRFVDDNKVSFALLGVAVTAVTAGLIRQQAVLAKNIIVTKAAAVGQLALNVAMSANPVGLVVAAIAALAAGLIFAYKNSETFRSGVIKVFQVVSNVVLGYVKGLLEGVKFFAKVSDKIFGTDFESSVQKGIDAVDSLRDRINRLDDKTVTITVNNIENFKRNNPQAAQTDAGELRTIANRAGVTVAPSAPPKVDVYVDSEPVAKRVNVSSGRGGARVSRNGGI